MAIRPSVVVAVLICLGAMECAPQKPDRTTAPEKMVPMTTTPQNSVPTAVDTSGGISRMMKQKTVRHKTRPTKRISVSRPGT